MLVPSYVHLLTNFRQLIASIVGEKMSDRTTRRSKQERKMPLMQRLIETKECANELVQSQTTENGSKSTNQ